MNKLIVLFLPILFFATSSFAQNLNNEVNLVISPLKLDEQSSYQLLYRRSLKNDFMWRAGLRVFAQTDKETRADSVTLNRGTVQYDLSLGIQKNLEISGVEFINVYVGSDVYYNSAFNRSQGQDYYGYFWSTGIKPLFGLAYTPFDNIKLSLESRANLNFNFQKYEGTASNLDQRVSFRPLDQLALGLGYLF